MLEELSKLEQEILLKKELLKRNRELEKSLNSKITKLTDINNNILKDISNTEKALRFLKNLKMDKRNKDSNVVTKALNSIIEQLFPNEKLKFNISSKIKGNYTYSKLEYYKNNSTKPKLIRYRSGNGLRQAVSFTGIYTLLALSDNTPTIILDECFRSISPVESEVISEVLNNLSELGFQLILIEHNESIFKKLDRYGTYTLEKIFKDNTEYTRIKDYRIGGQVSG